MSRIRKPFNYFKKSSEINSNFIEMGWEYLWQIQFLQSFQRKLTYRQVFKFQNPLVFIPGAYFGRLRPLINLPTKKPAAMGGLFFICARMISVSSTCRECHPSSYRLRQHQAYCRACPDRFGEPMFAVFAADPRPLLQRLR